MEQERHELRLLLEQVQSECESKTIEYNEDKYQFLRQLDELRREQRHHDLQQTQLIQDLTETNVKLSKDLQEVKAFSSSSSFNETNPIFSFRLRHQKFVYRNK